MSPSPALNSQTLIALMQAMLEEFPLGLLLLDAKGGPIWFNQEANLVCNVWNQNRQGADSLPLYNTEIAVPIAIWEACTQLLASYDASLRSPPVQVSDNARGLHARIRLEHKLMPGHDTIFYLQLDYRRPRADRNRAVSPDALVLLNRLTFREREVAMRVREGLSTSEIAGELKRSPLTIKTQLASIYQKLGVKGRARVTALLNR